MTSISRPNKEWIVVPIVLALIVAGDYFMDLPRWFPAPEIWRCSPEPSNWFTFCR